MAAGATCNLTKHYGYEVGLQKGDYYTKLSSGVANMVNVTIYLKKNLVTKLQPFGLLQMSIFCLFHVHISFLFVRFLFIIL